MLINPSDSNVMDFSFFNIVFIFSDLEITADIVETESPLKIISDYY